MSYRVSAWVAFVPFLIAASFTPATQAQQAEIVVPIVAGVYVDPSGVLQAVRVGDPDDLMNHLRRGVPTTRANGAAANKTELRRVSLVRLAREVQSHIEAGKAIPDDARFLAGIQQIQYLFVYPDEHDVVIAGPAEGWESDASGRVVGQRTRQPVLRLDDLIVALRVFAPRGHRNTVVGCSIDQTDEGMRRFGQYMAKIPSSLDRRQVDGTLLQGARDSVGMQNITVWGIPPDSRLATVLVEADYRMKLIGIGLEDPRVRNLTTYYSLLGPGSVNQQKLQRWWFVPEYEAITASEAGDAFELLGQRAKLIGADDKLMPTGQAVRGGPISALTARFAQSFSAHFEELARINPAYAELKNAFDLVVVAALIDANDMIHQVAPDIDYLLKTEGGYEPERYPPPKQVESVVNAKWVGNKLAIGVGGGVIIDARKIAANTRTSPADSKLSHQRLRGRLDKSRWWND